MSRPARPHQAAGFLDYHSHCSGPGDLVAPQPLGCYWPATGAQRVPPEQESKWRWRSTRLHFFLLLLPRQPCTLVYPSIINQKHTLTISHTRARSVIGLRWCRDKSREDSPFAAPPSPPTTTSQICWSVWKQQALNFRSAPRHPRKNTHKNTLKTRGVLNTTLCFRFLNTFCQLFNYFF